METGIISEDKKSANVTAIHKKWKQARTWKLFVVCNCFIVSVVSKTMERIVKGRLITHLEINNVIGDSHHGF